MNKLNKLLKVFYYTWLIMIVILGIDFICLKGFNIININSSNTFLSYMFYHLALYFNNISNYFYDNAAVIMCGVTSLIYCDVFRKNYSLYIKVTNAISGALIFSSYILWGETNYQSLLGGIYGFIFALFYSLLFVQLFDSI